MGMCKASQLVPSTVKAEPAGFKDFEFQVTRTVEALCGATCGERTSRPSADISLVPDHAVTLPLL